MKNQEKLRFRKAEVIVMRWVAVCAFIGSITILSKDPNFAKLTTLVGCSVLLGLILLWILVEIRCVVFIQRHELILGDVVSPYITLQQMDHLDEALKSWFCDYKRLLKMPLNRHEEEKLKKFVSQAYKNVSNTKEGYTLTINMLEYPFTKEITLLEIKLEYQEKLNVSITYQQDESCMLYKTEVIYIQ